MSNRPSSPLTRRRFLERTALAGAALTFPAVLRSASPNGRVQVAAIGVDGQGYSDLHNVSSHAKAKFVGFCDVDLNRFARADKAVPGVPHFQDFRVMLEKLGNTVDAVIVSTPDHMHALIAIEAMKRGKHVYCQKPLAHNVWESRQMRLWAEKKNVVTQMGNHIHSAVEYRMSTRLIREGVIGKVKEVFSWVGVTGNERTRLLEPPAPGPVPAGFDWDLWIGGAPMRPYSPIVYHPFAWRDWQDFGGGAIGDFGCHILDPVFTALGIRAPLSVGADNTGINRHVWPTSEAVRYVFPGTEFTAGPTINVTWTDGGLRPNRKLAQMPDNVDLPGSGSLFIGEKGNMVLPHVGGPRLYPAENFPGFAYPKDIKGLNHYHRWVDAILDGAKTTDGFDYAGWLSEAAQLGNVATRLPKRPVNSRGKLSVTPEELNVLEWDAAKLQFKNSPEGNALLTRTYRKGWEVTPA
ncbi:MAG: Gfo/Idh/MocA family oxidoreductase [Opitutaceae bacterium]|nr:Gfo/Idh/MocA family oxidoreductase [Opitutaceae bacterium]